VLDNSPGIRPRSTSSFVNAPRRGEILSLRVIISTWAISIHFEGTGWKLSGINLPLAAVEVLAQSLMDSKRRKADDSPPASRRDPGASVRRRRQFQREVGGAATLLERRPAAPIFVTAGSLLPGVIQEPLAHVFPDGLRSGQPVSIGLLNLHDQSAPARHDIRRIC
jgi:hypothetical protein